MRVIGLQVAILAMLSSAVSALASEFGEPDFRNCTWCHGTSAQGYAPAPRLAGQRPQYIENQLKNFRNHTRNTAFSRLYMWGAAANIGAETARNLAMYLATLPPRSADDGIKELIPEGRAIYQEGVAELDIAACVVCHGPNAQGIREIPRLGGLAYSYLKRRLEEWRRGEYAAAVPPMPQIASKLSPSQIDALASYLSFVQ